MSDEPHNVNRNRVQSEDGCRYQAICSCGEKSPVLYAPKIVHPLPPYIHLKECETNRQVVRMWEKAHKAGKI